MEYQCQKRTKNQVTTWFGEITSLSKRDNHYEMEVQARGSYFHIIFGEHTNGHYACIPNWNIGCELASYSDLFWNIERISAQVKTKVDAISIAYAINAASMIM